MNQPKTAKKPPLAFRENYSVQARRDDLLDVCGALGLKVSNSASVLVVRRVMRERLVELNERGILPPDDSDA